MAARHASFAKLGAEVAELDAAAFERLRDAEALLDAGRPAGAIVMALYALEIRLKVAICRQLDLEGLPKPFETHDLEGLLVVSGLSRKLRRTKRPKDLLSNWEGLLAISEQAVHTRYSGAESWHRGVAERTLQLLTDPVSGVLRWLEKRS